jgi:pimeloyl-ACP methyl ester carboxylesterase
MAEIVGRFCEPMGTSTYYETIGEGKPVVCVHPVGGNTVLWRFVMQCLGEKGYRMIALDLPGHGKSLPKNWKPITSVKDYSEFVWEFIRLLGIRNPILMGNAMGANIVLRMAGEYPDEIRACVSAEGADYTPFGTLEGIELGRIAEHDLYQCSAVEWCGRATPKERARQLSWLYGNFHADIAVGDDIAYISHDARDLMPKVKCPVLLIRGEDDWIVPMKYVEDTKKRIRNAEIVIIKGTGHFPIWENPEKFCQICESFLRRI